MSAPPSPAIPIAAVSTARRPRASRPPKPPRPQPAADAVTPGRGGPGRALAIASVVLGALAVIGAFVPFVDYGSWFLGVVGMALGVVALLRRSRGRGLALGGTILSGVGFLLSVILAAVYTVGFVTSWSTSLQGNPDASVSSPDVAVEAIPAVYGQTVTYDDGLQLQVSAPTTIEPSSDARGSDQEWNLSFTVTIYNGSPAAVALDPSLDVVSGDVTGTPIIDPQSGLDGVTPSGTIPVGQTQSWVIGYSVANPTVVVVQASPAPPYLVSRFTN